LVKAGNRSLQKLFDEIINMDDNYRYLVRKSMVKIGARIVEPLIRLFKLKKPEIKAFAASTLGEIGNPRAVPTLVTGLSDEDWNVRRSCAYALTEIGERGVDKIAEALKSPNEDVRYWVTRILESVGEPGVPYLVKALRDSSKEIRFFSAKALGSALDTSVTKDLILALSDEVWSVRKAAAESLCKLENLPIDEVMRYLSSDNEDIRYWVSYVIKEVGHEYVNDIIEAMRRGDAELRLFACQAAGMIENEPELIEALIVSLKDDSEWVRIYSAISLGRTGDERSIVPLIRCFSDRNTEVHRNVVHAFKKMGDKVHKELLKCIESEDPDLRKNSALALGEMHDKSGLDYVIMLLEDPDVSVRAVAAESLGGFPCHKARGVLQHALGDSEIKVRLAAIKAIGNLGTEEDALALMIYGAKQKEGTETKAIHRILGDMAINNPDLFIEMFKNEQLAIRNMAYESLVTAGIEALPRLTIVAAESKDENQVTWCKKAIRQIKRPKESMFYV
jgi:HEAT repeat protein